jgi:hypothetical protein
LGELCANRKQARYKDPQQRNGIRGIIRTEDY